MDRMKRKHLELMGWLIFLACAVCFVITSIGSTVAMIGSLLFVAGCLVFLIPFFVDLD